MSLIDFNIDPKLFLRFVGIAERIANALDRAYPIPVQSEATRKPLKPEDAIVNTDESLWELEQEEERKRQQGLLSEDAVEGPKSPSPSE